MSKLKNKVAGVNGIDVVKNKAGMNHIGRIFSKIGSVPTEMELNKIQGSVPRLEKLQYKHSAKLIKSENITMLDVNDFKLALHEEKGRVFDAITKFLTDASCKNLDSDINLFYELINTGDDTYILIPYESKIFIKKHLSPKI
jgi:hypothetical protein